MSQTRDAQLFPKAGKNLDQKKLDSRQFFNFNHA
jgi:hypothetical protein